MSSRIIHHIVCWWPSALVIALVLWLTLAPDPAPDVPISALFGPYTDKLVHAIMMGGITGAIIFDYKRRQPGAPRRMTKAALAALGIAMIIFSGADEYAQGAMGLGRTPDIWDFAADLTGVAVALLTAPAVCNALLRKVLRPKARV